MKKIFILIAFLFTISLTQAQWAVQNMGTQEILRNVKFVNSKIGWITGNSGGLFKTTDGGSNWFSQNSGTTNSIYGIFPIDTAIVYACNSSGNMMKSTNGGNTWNVSYNGYSPLNIVYFINSNVGWCVGYDGVIIKTTNAGLSWNSLNSRTSNILTNVYFTDLNNGYVTGVSGTFLVTTDGGTSWNYGNIMTDDWLFSVKFVNQTTGFVVGGITNRDQAIYKTTNAGLTWERKSTPSIGVLNSVDFVDLSNGWGVGDRGVIMHTSDGGETWDVQSSNTINDLNIVCMLSNEKGYSVGFNGFLAKYNAVPSSFIITSPSSGDNWPISSVKSISWTSNVTNVNIDYTINGGQTWNNIANQISNSGNYNWTIPDAASSFCKVRVSESGNPSNYGLSNSFFHIIPNNINAVISADTIYYDTDFKGYVNKQVSGNNSTGLNLTYNWLINDTLSFNEVSPFIILNSGINKIKLTVKDQSEATRADSIFTNVIASRNITGGAIYSGVSQYKNHFYTTSADKGVYEIDSTGRKLKMFLTGGSIQSVLSISQQGKLFTGSSDTRIYGFDTQLIPLWDKSTGGLINYSPALSYDGSTVYCVTSTANIIAIDVQSGNIKWGFPTDGYVTNSPVVFLDSSNTNIIYAGTSNGMLYAIRDNGSSGELFWQRQLSDTLFSSIAIFPDGLNSMIYLGAKSGYLYRMKWNGDYDESWKVNLNSPVYSSPVIDGNGLIYIGTKNGTLSGYSRDFTSSSTPLSSITLESGIIGTPAISSSGNIYVGTDKGYLYSLYNNNENFQIKWKANLYSSINSSALVTESGLIYIGTSRGDIFVLKEYSQENSLSAAKWPTFKGDNLRSKVFSLSVTSVKDNQVVLSDYNLLQNYPNPFNPSTIIKFAIPVKGNVKLTIYNQLGEVVEVLADKEMEPGNYNITWNPRNISSGVYFYEIKTNKFISAKKAIFIK